MSIRQQNDSPPDYNTAVEDSILPVIPKSNKIYPIVQPVQYNSLTINSDFPQDINQPNVNYPRHNIQQSGANNNIGFRPLPPLVVPSQSSMNNSSAKRQKPPTFSKQQTYYFFNNSWRCYCLRCSRSRNLFHIR